MRTSGPYDGTKYGELPREDSHKQLLGSMKQYEQSLRAGT
jgi:hypothetical protein